MAIARKALRQELGFDLNELYVGTLSAGNVNVLTDDALIDPDESASKYDRAWVRVTSGAADGEVRRVRDTDVDAAVTGYDPDNGTLTLSRALTGLPVATDTFELHSLLNPTDLDTCINRALRKCHYLERETIDPVADQREYALAGYAWITSRALVRDVYWRYGDTALEYRYRRMRWWKVTEDAGVLTLHVRPYGVDGKYVLEGIKAYAELDTDAATTECPEDWVKAGAEMEVYRFLAHRGPAEDSKRYKALQVEAAGLFGALARAYQPRPKIRVQLHDTPWVM